MCVSWGRENSLLAGALMAAICMTTAPSLQEVTSGGSGESRTPKEVATTDDLRRDGEARENALIPEKTRAFGTSEGTREKGNNRIVELEGILLERRSCIWLCFAVFKFWLR